MRGAFGKVFALQADVNKKHSNKLVIKNVPNRVRQLSRATIVEFSTEI
jgi:hypothetical protein